MIGAYKWNLCKISILDLYRIFFPFTLGGLFFNLYSLCSRNTKVIIMRAIFFNNLIFPQANYRRYSKALNALKDEYSSYYIGYFENIMYLNYLKSSVYSSWCLNHIPCIFIILLILQKRTVWEDEATVHIKHWRDKITSTQTTNLRYCMCFYDFPNTIVAPWPELKSS